MRSDGEGAFEFRLPESNDTAVFLIAGGHGYSVMSRRIDPVRFGDAVRVDVQVRKHPFVDVEVQVLDENGRPVSGGSILARALGESTPDCRMILPDRQVDVFPETLWQGTLDSEGRGRFRLDRDREYAVEVDTSRGGWSEEADIEGRFFSFRATDRPIVVRVPKEARRSR
jgi:hypothetical protein